VTTARRALGFALWAFFRAWAVFCPKDEIFLFGELYMTRFYLRGTPGGDGPSVRLQHIHMPDGDRRLHNHPWHVAESIILRGGYVEERETSAFPWEPYATAFHYLRALDRNSITASTLHRIIALDSSECWTLFRTSEQHGRGWGFR